MDGIDTGIQFDFTYAPGVSLEQMIGFEMAGQFWSDYLTDDVSINIFVEITDMLPENVLGGALPGMEVDQSYMSFRDSLKRDMLSGADEIAVGNLPGNSEFTAMVNGATVSGNIDYGKKYMRYNNTQLNLTRANTKAIELLNDPNSELVSGESRLDGYILLSDLSNITVNQDNDRSNDLKWHYGFDSNIVPHKKLDFLSVAIHEIGHVLGFVSGVDDVGNSGTNNSDSMKYTTISVLDRTKTPEADQSTSIDLFRYSSQSAAVGAIDMSVGGDAFFSLDRKTVEANFATGEDSSIGGDGYQASHWKYQEGKPLGIMDPLLAPGQRRQISALDQKMFDVIGYNLDTEGKDLTTIYNEAKTLLAEKMEVTVNWMDANSTEAAALLTPDYLDKDNDGYDDRGELLNEMIVGSEVYEWGWSGYFWGWSGYWWGWSGYWQSAAEQDGLWQHFSQQTIDVSLATKSNNESSSQGELPGLDIFPELDIFGISDNIVRGKIKRTDNNYNHEQNRDWFAEEDNDILLSNLKEQESDFSDLAEGDRNEQTDQESDSLLSDGLVSELLEQSFLKDDMVIPI